MQPQVLINTHRFTILLGKNGSGKSTLLRSLDRNDPAVKYITPERGGTLKYEPNIDNNIQQNINWLSDSRRRNRFESFRQQSAAQFRNLEILFLREMEKTPGLRQDLNHNFDKILANLNEYLPAIRLVRADRGFSIENMEGVRIDEDQISSGEAEFIAQAIELLVYARTDAAGKLLLFDEPDVHLHPDLQCRFAQLIEKTAIEHDIRVVIATHSTAIASGFSLNADLQVVPVTSRSQTEFEGFERSEVSDQLLPIFGSHPLSTHFVRSPIVLVEGEDDRRVIEQFVRSSNGRVLRSPCVVGTVGEMNRWEQWLVQFLPAIYDSPIAYSLRDLDDGTNNEIDDIGFVKRSKLNCYSMENLLLTDESLVRAGCSSDQLLSRLSAWDADHPLAQDVAAFVSNFESRRIIKIKSIRNIVTALMGVTKPWEVHLGQVLSDVGWGSSTASNSLRVYLGDKAKSEIFAW